MTPVNALGVAHLDLDEASGSPPGHPGWMIALGLGSDPELSRGACAEVVAERTCKQRDAALHFAWTNRLKDLVS